MANFDKGNGTHFPPGFRQAATTLLIACLLLAASVVWTEALLPATDVFLFKEAGVNLALTNSFRVRDLPHMTPGEERTYSYYPPVYPLAFGLWSKGFGVGLKQSLTFNRVLQIFRALLMLALAMCLAGRKSFSSKAQMALGILLLVFSSMISSDGDRPDELALVFGLSSLLIFLRWERSGWGWAAGVLLGLCGMTSPTAGVFFGILLFALLVGDKGWVRRFAIIAGISCLVSSAILGLALYRGPYRF